MMLHLRPMGYIEERILAGLKAPVGNIFGVSVKVDQPVDVPEYAYNPDRGQYYSSFILAEMMRSLPKGVCKVLGIVDVDLYVPRLNFVFGEARDPVAVISITRLRQEYYGLPGDNLLFRERVTTEAVHEIGHMFGLGHCPDRRCVMHFSNSLEDTDIKSYNFCPKCGAQYHSSITA